MKPQNGQNDIADIVHNHCHYKIVVMVKNRKKEMDNYSVSFSYLNFSVFTQIKVLVFQHFMYTFVQKVILHRNNQNAAQKQ